MKVKLVETFGCSDQNFSSSLCQFWNYKLIPLQVLHSSSVSWKITPLYFFNSNDIYFAQKEPIKIKFFETFKSSGQTLSNSSCQLWHDKSVPLQILHNHSLPWQITPLWILRSYFFKFGIKGPIKIPILSSLKKICHIPHLSFSKP